MSLYRSETRSDRLARGAMVVAAVAVVGLAGVTLWATTRSTDDGSAATGIAIAGSPPEAASVAAASEDHDDTSGDSTNEATERPAGTDTAADPDDDAECVFGLMGLELSPGYDETWPCPSGATLHVTAPDGYGHDGRPGGPSNDRNKASAATADKGIRVEIRNPSSTDPFVVIPADQPGCFAQYIIEAGFEWIPMIDAAEAVIFDDDGRAKSIVANEDCADDDVAGDGAGDELTITYRPAP